MSVCEIAREAGEYIARQRETFTFADVEFKGTQNMVSYVDKQTEMMIVSRLRELTPEAGYITEEGTIEASEDASLRWIVDPLDGTTNFIHGLAPYCVSIGLLEDDELVVGVVYEVNLREMFYAWKGSDFPIRHWGMRTVLLIKWSTTSCIPMAYAGSDRRRPISFIRPAGASMRSPI